MIRGTRHTLAAIGVALTAMVVATPSALSAPPPLDVSIRVELGGLDGNRVRGIGVEVLDWPSKRVLHAAPTALNGVARFTTVRPDRSIALRVPTSGWKPVATDGARALPSGLVLVERPTEDMLLRFEQASYATVHVHVRTTDRVVAGATIALAHADTVEQRGVTAAASLRQDRHAPRTLSSADGGFTFDRLTPGVRYCVVAYSAKHAPTLSAPFVASAAAPARVSIKLNEGKRINLRVVSAAGDPIEGVRVTVAECAPATDPRVAGYVGPRTGPSRDRPVHWRAKPTDSSGSVTLGPFGGVDVFVLVRAAGFVPAPLPGKGALRLDDTRSTATVVLHRGADVEGRVVDAHGAPMEGMLVQIMFKRRFVGGSSSETIQSTRSDGRGRFSMTGVPESVGTGVRLALRVAEPSKRRNARSVSRDVKVGTTNVVVFDR